MKRRVEVLMMDERRLLKAPPLPSEPGGVSAVTREEQGIVGGRPPLQHEGDGEKQRSHNPLGRIKSTEGEFLLDHLCEDPTFKTRTRGHEDTRRRGDAGHLQIVKTSSASRDSFFGKLYFFATVRTFL